MHDVRFGAGVFTQIPIRHHQRKLVHNENTPYEDTSFNISSMKKLKALKTNVQKRFPKAKIVIRAIKNEPNAHWAAIDTTLTYAEATPKQRRIQLQVDRYLQQLFQKNWIPFAFTPQIAVMEGPAKRKQDEAPLNTQDSPKIRILV